MPDETDHPADMAPELEERLFEAARTGDVGVLAAAFAAQPAALQIRDQPYGHTLLHVAARHGQLAVVELLLERGLDANVREVGDNTGPINWAAAGGHLEVVRRLAEAGADVVGLGDDHQLEVIGWATCWPGCDDEAHRAVAELLVARGARHHIFSAIALELEDELRRIVAEDAAALERSMSHNENFQRPLHFAVGMRRQRMVKLLLELGADPQGTDGSGATAAAYASSPELDRPILEAVRARGGPPDLAAAVALADWATAEHLLAQDRAALDRGALHLMARRGDGPAVQWLLARGADPNARWNHFGAEVVPLHLAAMHGHGEVVKQLLAAGADPHIRDSRHGGDAFGWADYFGRPEIVELLNSWTGPGQTPAPPGSSPPATGGS